MKYVTLLLVLFSIALVGCAPQAAETPDEATDLVEEVSATEQSPLEGVWQIVEASGTNSEGDWTTENVQPSLYMFMDGYYSIILVHGNEPRPLMPEGATWDTMTEQQLRSVCSGAFFSANSGTYEVSGSSLTTRPMVAKWPNFMDGGSSSFTYRVEDGYLYLSIEGESFSWNAKLTRLN